MNKKEYALNYAKAGLKIFPLHWITEDGKCSCGKPDCVKNSWGKHTIYKLAPDSHKNATNDLATIEKWWSAYPDANIGLACSANGLFVVDVDLHEGKANGFESLDDFETTAGDALGDVAQGRVFSGVTQHTGGGGVHMLFRAPANLATAPSGLGRNYPGVDFKFNGYILLEPSNHASGRFYEFETNDKGVSVSLTKLLNGDIPPLAPALIWFLQNQQTPNYSPARYTVPRRDIDSDDIDQIREALNCIPFDGIDYDEKLKIGMGLQFALPGGDGKALYFDWLHSNLGSRFKIKQSEKHWRSFKYRSGGRTIASVFEIAANFGFVNEGKPGTFVDEADYIMLELSPVATEVKEGDVIMLDAIADNNSPSKIFMLKYWYENGLPEGSIFIDESVRTFPVGGLLDYQKTYIIDKWQREGIGQFPDMAFLDLPITPINYPYFIDFDDEGEEVTILNPSYQPPARQDAALINSGMTSGGMRGQNFVIPVTGDDELNRKLQEIATRPNPIGDGWPTQDQYEQAHAQLGNIRSLCALYDWHVQRSGQYVHELSLTFALSVMSTLLAGRFTHKGLTTNLYMILIAETSIGKTMTIQLMSQVFAECKEDLRVGPSDIVSDKGFYNDLKTNRAKLFPIDEWGHLQRTIFSEKANGSQQLIRRALLSAFTAFGSTHNKTASRADDKNFKAVDLGPLCPSIFGCSTEVAMFETLNKSFVDDGFLTRFLLMMVNGDAIPEAPKTIVTENDQCRRAFFEWYNQARGIFKGPSLDYPEWENAKCDTFVVTEMAVSAESEALLTAIKEIESDMKRNGGDFGNIFARMREIVIRMAITFEIAARPHSKVIERASVELAFKLVRELLKSSHATATRRIVANQTEAIIRDVMEFMEKGQHAYTYNQMKVKTPIKDYQLREQREALNEMLDRRMLRKFRPKEKKRGRPELLFAPTACRGLCSDILNTGNWEEC